MESPGSVADHYDTFPFPVVRDDLRGTGVTVSSLPPGARLWIAGCGTMQAARWGGAFPDHDIVATDVSASTLAVASTVAQRWGVGNVSFAQADLRAARFRREFDLVVCTGVVHHLEVPHLGLQAIAAALTRAGEALLMVYRTSLRHQLRDLREEVLDAAGPGASAAARFGAAQALLAGQTDPLCVMLRRLAIATPTKMADAIANPIEHTYEQEDLPTLLGQGGLAFDRWARPGEWESDEPAVVRRRQLEFFARRA